MSKDTDPLNELRDLLKQSQGSLAQCQKSYKGFRVFKGNNGGIVFCAVQLQQAAAALRDQANALVAVAAVLHTGYRDSELSEQLELHDFDMNGQP